MVYAYFLSFGDFVGYVLDGYGGESVECDCEEQSVKSDISA